MLRELFWSLAAIAAMGLVCCPTTEAEIMDGMMNWEGGVVTITPAGGPPVNYNVTYTDAHVEIKYVGYIQDEPNSIQTSDAGFTKPVPTVKHGDPDDTLTVDWQLADPTKPMVGACHLGVAFYASTLGTTARPRVTASYLTGASVSSPYLNFSSEKYSLVGPTSGRWRPSGSGDWEFSIDDPAITNSVSFKNITFYKRTGRPNLSDLTAANFPSLTKTLLGTEPDFQLLPGETHNVHLEGVDAPEYILVYYETSWLDPVLMAWATPGTLVYSEVHTWAAGQLIPEPATLALLALSGLAVIRRRYSRRTRLSGQQLVSPA